MHQLLIGASTTFDKRLYILPWMTSEAYENAIKINKEKFYFNNMTQG